MCLHVIGLGQRQNAQRDHGLFEIRVIAAPRCLTRKGILQVYGKLYLADAGDAAKDDEGLLETANCNCQARTFCAFS